MNTAERRGEILKILHNADAPVAARDTIYDVIKQVDDLCDNCRNCQLRKESGDTSRLHIGCVGLCFHDGYLREFCSWIVYIRCITESNIVVSSSIAQKPEVGKINSTLASSTGIELKCFEVKIGSAWRKTVTLSGS